jgi:hypothetical protein
MPADGRVAAYLSEAGCKTVNIRIQAVVSDNGPFV